MSNALLIVAHGTRSEEGAAECRALADEVRAARPDLPVELGNLELAEPEIGDAVDALAGRGCDTIVAVPLVLFAARHAKTDIPEALSAEAGRHPQVRVRMADHLGHDRRVTDVATDRIRAVSPPAHDAETTVVLVRAGSTDPDARGDIARAAGLLRAQHAFAGVTFAFAGIADPTLDAALDTLREQGSRSVVVVPYLLFTGDLAGRVQQQAQDYAHAHPEMDVRVAGYLGPDPRIADLVLDRFDRELTRRDARCQA